MKIDKTNKYEKFKTIGGNRVLDEGHIKKLERSILKKNLLDYNPIIVNQNFQVIDGQHRLEVCKRNNLAVPYIVIKGADIEDVQVLNEANREWHLIDFATSWAERGNGHYQVLLDFTKTYSLPITVAMSLLQESKSGRLVPRMKRGNFEIKSEDSVQKAVTIIEYCNMFEPMVDNPRVLRSRNFIDAIRILIDKEFCNIRELAEKGVNIQHSIKKQQTTRNYVRAFEDIYNRSKSTGRAYFNY